MLAFYKKLNVIASKFEKIYFKYKSNFTRLGAIARCKSNYKRLGTFNDWELLKVRNHCCESNLKKLGTLKDWEPLL